MFAAAYRHILLLAGLSRILNNVRRWASGIKTCWRVPQGIFRETLRLIKDPVLQATLGRLIPMPLHHPALPFSSSMLSIRRYHLLPETPSALKPAVRCIPRRARILTLQQGWLIGGGRCNLGEVEAPLRDVSDALAFGELVHKVLGEATVFLMVISIHGQSNWIYRI